MAEIILFNDKRSANAGSSSSATAYAVQSHVVHDWDNQELADLFRVKRLLDQAGVHVETDRGVTDEGDPWFTFCHPNGDVFVHLARFDGEYLLDSTNIEAPLRGNSFNDLINSFVDRAVEKRAANIVSLRPGEGVFLHPAIMLTALIWTMFVASDELVGIAHGAEVEQAADDFDFLLNAPLAETDGAFGVLQAALAERDAEETAENSGTKNTVEPAERETQTTASTTILPNPVSLSLTAIAVTFGMSSKSSFEFLQNGQAEAALGTLFAADDLNLDATVSSEFAETEQEFRAVANEFSTGDDVEVAAVDQNEVQTSAQNDLNVLDVPNALLLATTLDANSNETGFDAGVGENAEVEVSTSSVAMRSKAAASEETVQEEAVSVPAVDEDVLEVSAGFGLNIDLDEYISLSTYNVANQELLASFDISNTQGFDLASILEPSETVVETAVIEDTGPKATGKTIRAGEITEYTQEAMSFVKFLLSQRDTVEMVVLEGKIILVDLSAFDEVTDISYLRSWAYDDVGIVSTIGHYADFEAFDLVMA